MTLGEMLARAATEPAEVKASRRRRVVKRMQRLGAVQRERDLIDLGWREPDAGWEGERQRPLLPLIGFRDHGGE